MTVFDPSEYLSNAIAHANENARDRVTRSGLDDALAAALGAAWTPQLTTQANLDGVASVLFETGLAQGDQDSRWWVPMQQSRTILDWARADNIDDSLAAALQRVSAAVTAVVDEPGAVPDSMRRLVEIIADDAGNEGAIADNLMRLVEGADVADALNYIDAASRLEPVSDEVAAARLRASRMVDGRSAEERRTEFLRNYYRRDNLHGRLEEFVYGSRDRADDRWAIHAVGRGGAGKSMLVQAFAAGFPDDGQKGSIAVVDFDHLDPDYPLRKPALLLSALLAGLERFGGRSTSDARLDFDLFGQDWSDRVVQSEVADAASLPDLRVERMSTAHDAFARLLYELPAPVVLVLDTCEELDKLATPMDDHVSALFESLEAIHDRLPTVRVVLAGRRELAAGGAGWIATGNSNGRPFRPYLERLEVGPFTHEEALGFVEFRGVAEPMRDRIIDAAADPEGRINPFDLQLLCNWSANADPDDDPRSLDLDRFLEQRILFRLADVDVKEAVAAVVMLRTFDIDTLGSVTGTQGEQLSQLWLALGAQEWVDAALTPLLTIDANMADRLASYYERRQPMRWRQLQDKAAEYFAGLAATGGLTVAHDPTHRFLSALRFIDDTPGWWETVENRCVEDEQLTWLDNLAQEALRVLPAHHPARPSVLATVASLRQRERRTTVPQWSDVEAAAELDTTPWLRAMAQQCRYRELLDCQQRRPPTTWPESVFASLIAGIQRSLDFGTGESDYAGWVSRLAASAGVDSRLRVAATTLHSCALVADGDVATAVGVAAVARQGIDDLVREPADRRWIDWQVSDPAAQLRTSIAQAWWPKYASPESVGGWLGQHQDFGNADAAAEASLQIVLQLAGGAVVDVPVRCRPFAPTCGLHDRVPPLGVSRVMALAFHGRLEEAVNELSVVEAEIASIRPAAGASLQAAQRALLTLARRFLLRDAGIALQSPLQSSTHLEDVAALGALDMLDGSRAGLPAPYKRLPFDDSPGARRAAWRSTRADDPLAMSIAMSWPPAAQPQPGQSVTFEELQYLLDDVERQRLRGDEGPDLGSAVLTWCAANRDPRDTLLLALRCAALYRPSEAITRVIGTAATSVGIRLAAEIAVDEGGLLALRLPSEGRRLLIRAESWFVEAFDKVGALRARVALALLERRNGDTVDTDALRSAVAAADIAAVPLGGIVEDPVAAVDAAGRHAWGPIVGRIAWALSEQATPAEGRLSQVLGKYFATPADDGTLAFAAEFGVSHRPEESTAGRTPVTVSLLALGRGTNAWLHRGGIDVLVSNSDDEKSEANLTVSAFDESAEVWHRAHRGASATPAPADASIASTLGRFVTADSLVCIHHDVELSAVNWERHFSDAGVEATFRRVRRASRRGPSAADARDVVLLGDERLASTWRGVPAVRFESEITNSVPPNAALVHVHGGIREDSIGLGLVTARRAYDTAPLRPDALASVFPNVVVLQPGESKSQPQYVVEALFRHYGGELALLGVPVVLVLPLSTESEPLTSLHRLVTSRALDAGRVLDVVSELRAGLSGEVTLYMSDILM